jgi:hypothetical protein
MSVYGENYQFSLRSERVALWDVNDQSTAEFMKLFYEHLKTSPNKAQVVPHPTAGATKPAAPVWFRLRRVRERLARLFRDSP